MAYVSVTQPTGLGALADERRVGQCRAYDGGVVEKICVFLVFLESARQHGNHYMGSAGHGVLIKYGCVGVSHHAHELSIAWGGPGIPRLTMPGRTWSLTQR